MQLILASNSPRRRALLDAAGFVFTVLVGHDQEVWPAGPAEAGAIAVAEQKWAAALAALPQTDLSAPLQQSRQSSQSLREQSPQAPPPPPQNLVWLAADTAVVIDGDVLGKPTDAAHAQQMLQRLAGRRHEVITGFVVARGEQVVWRQSVTTEVTMRAYSRGELQRYVATGECVDKAGAYAVQGEGGRLVDRLSGSLSNVVGLPLTEVCAALAQVGVVPADAALGAQVP